MSKPCLRLNLVVALLAIGIGASGCGTSSYTRPDTRQVVVSPQLKEHQRKQQLRYREGNYKRLYRPKGCRFAATNCDGFPRMPSS